jgi:hypothetical protein
MHVCTCVTDHKEVLHAIVGTRKSGVCRQEARLKTPGRADAAFQIQKQLGGRIPSTSGVGLSTYWLKPTHTVEGHLPTPQTNDVIVSAKKRNTYILT